MTKKIANIGLLIRRALVVGPVLLATIAFGQQRHTDESRGDQKTPVRSDAVSLVTGSSQQLQTIVAGVGATAVLAVTPVNPPAGLPPYPAGVTIVGNELLINRNNMDGFRAWFNVQLSDWDPLGDGPNAVAYQVKIDCAGYYQSDSFDVKPNDTCNGGANDGLACVGDWECPGGSCGLDLKPAVVACPGDDPTPCSDAFGESWARCTDGLCDAGYVDAVGARPDSWCAPSGGGCNVTKVALGTCNYNYAAVSNTPSGHPDQPFTCVGGARPGQGCTVNADCPNGGACTDPKLPYYYVGTLVLDIPAGAKGKYTVNLNQDETYLARPGIPPEIIESLAETGFIVNIVTGKCCFGFGTPNAGCIDSVTQAECGDDEPAPFVFGPGELCDNPPGPDGCCECVPGPDPTCADNDACTIEACNNCRCQRQLIAGFDPETECCHPSTGAVATRIDADQCTTDTCSFGESRGVPQHTLSPLGAPCTDRNVCTVNDACDGIHTAAQGGCVVTDLYTAACEDALCPETNPNGVPCDDLNPCTMNDVCDAQGSCQGTPEVGCDTGARTPINCACDVPTTRSIALLVPSSTPESPTALQVRMVDLQSPDPPNVPQYPPPNFIAFEAGTCTAAGESNGCARWVGTPGTFLESQDIPGGEGFRASRLQCTPTYHNWGTEPVVHVFGAEIIPSSIYEVRSFASSCMGDETTCTEVSAPIQVVTGRYGNVEAPYNPPSSTQPNAIDVAQLVNKFKNLPGALVKAISQLQPNLPELNADINSLDILLVVRAAREFAYPFYGPCPCPSLVPCDPAMGSVACATATPCIAAFGAGALCVKTCNGGGNAGDPCINNTHCPGSGTCGNGFCRDACGRCSP